MKSSLALLIAVLALLAAAPQSPNPRQSPNREIAVTFDDPPIAGVLSHDLASSRAITSKLLTAITAHRLPAVGFVNEGKLGGDRDLMRRVTDAYVPYMDAKLAFFERNSRTYVGSGGITWIHRWALTKGVGKDFFAGEPGVPAFVGKAAQP